MLPSPVAEVAAAYAASQQQLDLAVLSLVSQALQVGRGQPDRWTDAVANMGAQLLAIQVASAALADDYLAEVLDAQGADPASDAAVDPNAFADITDGGGSLLLNLVYAPNSVVEQAHTQQLSTAQMLRTFEYVATSVVATAIQDTGRAAVQTAMFGHPSARYYVRMLNGTSCARCAILAGRRYRRQERFRRHENCDCRHIPAAEAADDWTVNPVKYFKSLSHEEQDRIFTKAGAEAIRLSGVKQVAMNQIVNARQGIDTVSAYGRQIQITREGTTVRALYGGYEVMSEPLPHGGFLRRRGDDELQRVPGVRYRVAKAPRLLPDEVFRLADEFSWDRTEVLRQLRRFGYLI